jgi:hypothetical protein
MEMVHQNKGSGLSRQELVLCKVKENGFFPELQFVASTDLVYWWGQRVLPCLMKSKSSLPGHTPWLLHCPFHVRKEFQSQSFALTLKNFNIFFI